MRIRPRSAVLQRAFWAGLILLCVPIALAVITPTPTSVSVFPGQTSPSIRLDLTWATPTTAGGTGSIRAAGVPGGTNLVPNPITYPYVANATSATTNFQFQVTQQTPPGTYNVQLTDGSNNAGFTNVTLIVNTPSFTASISPNPGVMTLGGPALPVTVTTTVDPGFSAGSINYAFSGFPNFIFPGPAQSTPAPNYPPVTFNFTLGRGAVPGTYNGTLTGTYLDPFGLPQTKTFPYVVIVQQPDIGASFSNPAVTLCEGGAAVSDNINLVPLNGYTGTPTLSFISVPAGIIVNPLNPPANPMPPAQSIPFTIRASGATPGPQTVILNVSDASVGINKNITLNVTVTTPDFTPTTSPSTINLVNGGGGQSITASVTPNACFTASVTVTPSGTPPGIVFTPPSTTISGPGYPPATFIVQANVPPGAYTATFTFTPSSGTPKTTTVTINVTAAPDFRLTVTPSSVSLTPGQSASVTVSATGVNGFGGSINVTAPQMPGVTYSPASFTLVPGGSQVVTVTASNGATPGPLTGAFSGTAAGITGARTVPFTVNVNAGPDFSLSANPAVFSLPAGQSTTVTVSAAGLNGFNGIVNVTAPASADFTFSPASFSIPAGGSQAVTVTALTTAPLTTFTGTFTGTAAGVNGQRFASITITVTPSPDFTLAVQPQTVTIAQAGTATVTVTATPINGFTGPISVTNVPSPGVTVTPATFTMIPGAPQTVTVTIAATAPTGGATVIFNGTAAGVNGPRTATLSIAVSARPDFSLSVTPPSIKVPSRGFGTATVMVIGSNAFIGAVQITGAAPAGVTLTPATFTLNPGESQPVRIDATAAANIASGTIRFTGTSGDLIHTADLFLNVTAPKPVITSIVPPAIATGARSMVLRVNGQFFQPGARIDIANTGVRIENVAVISSQIADVTLSVYADASPGGVQLVLTNPDNGSANGPVLVYPRGSIAAPLGVTSAVIVFPAEGTLISPTQNVFPRGLLATTGTGTIIGSWKFDGVPFDRFTVNVGGGYPAEVKTHLPLPTSYIGGHTLELQIEAPQLAVSPALHIIMAASSVSRLTILAPRDGTVIAGVAPLFRWSLVPNSSGYLIEIENNARVRLSDSEWKLDRQTMKGLAPGIHRWRVRAVFPGETEGEPTEWQRFAILPQQVNLTVEPSIVDPATQRTRIRWSGGIAGLLYRVDVLDTTGKTIFSALTPANEYLLPAGISGSIRVTAIGPGGVSLGQASGNVVRLRSDPHGAIFLAQLRPAVTNQQPASGTRVETSQPHIAATWSGAVRAEDVSLLLDQTDVTPVSTITATSISYDSLLPLAAGTHTVRLTLAGEVTTWTFDVAEISGVPAPAPSTLHRDWAVTPNGTITMISGDGPGQNDDARVQISAQTDLANAANGAKITGDVSMKHALNDPNNTVQESRNWLTDFNRQQGPVKAEAKIGYSAPDFLDQSELLATGVARGGVEGRVHLSSLIASAYETVGTRPAGVLAGDFGPKQTIRAAALQTETNEKWDFRVVGFRVSDDPGINSAGGLGKAVGIFAKYIFDPKLTAIVEASRGSFEPNPQSAQTKREGSALRLDLSGTAGTFNYVLNLRRTEADYVNPANRGFTPGGVPDRTGANLSLTKVISRTSISVQLRALRDGNSSGAILPRNRENGGTLAISTSLGQSTTLALGGNWTADHGSGNPTLLLPDLDRNQSGVNGTLTEVIGRFNLSQNITVQKLRDRINPISDSTTTAGTVTFGGAVVTNVNFNAVLSGTRSEGSEAVGTNDQFLASLQPSFTIPRIGVMLQPRVNYSRSKNDLTSLESRSEQYQGLVTWAPTWVNSFLSVQVSADASRNRSTGQILPAKFVHQYVGTLSLKWGAGSGAAMNGTTVVTAPADVSATKTNDPNTTAAVSQ